MKKKKNTTRGNKGNEEDYQNLFFSLKNDMLLTWSLIFQDKNRKILVALCLRACN